MVTHPLLDFNKRTSETIGILPQLPITLGGKNICIGVLIFHDPLDFNFLLGWDYVYAMKFFVSTLFRVMHFPHNGKIVTINQISFIGFDLNAKHLIPVNVPYMQIVSHPP
jgi:hypothetical protein